MSSIKELERCINIHKNIIRASSIERERLIDSLGPSGYKNGTSYNDYDSIHGTRAEKSIPEIIEEISRLDNIIYLEKNIIDKTQKNINDIKESIKGLSGLELKIQEMILVEGKNLKEIADELSYSYDHIRRVKSKIKPQLSHSFY